MIGCQYCCEPELFSTFRSLNEDYVPGANLVNEYNDELGECPFCRENLLKNDYIVVDKECFLEESLKYLANRINREIYECQYCSTIITTEQQYGDSLNLKTVNELVDKYSIPTHLQIELYEYLKCNCGNPVSFDDPYITKDEFDDCYRTEADFIVTTFNVSGEETIDFIGFLEKYPMLGLAHSVGKEIFNKIKNNSFPGIEEIKPGQIFYRGRTRNKLQRLVPFIEEELWNPPLGIPYQGRFNPHGVTNLYLGDKEEAILLEISPSKLDVVDIAEFEILQSLKVFNSTKTDIDLFAGMEKEENGFSSSYEYIFPNFLAQCLSHLEFNGIVYKSVKYPTALNLCLFNFERDKDICMNKIYENASLSHEDDTFGLNPSKRTAIIERKNTFDLTQLF